MNFFTFIFQNNDSDLHLQHAWNQCSYCSIRKNVHYVAMGFCLFY